MNSPDPNLPLSNLSLGDNAMVAGDIHHNVKITTQLVTGSCGSCGRELRAGFSWKCGSCGTAVCQEHFDKKSKLCEKCHQGIRNNALREYGESFASLRAQGPIDPSKRGLLAEKASALGLADSEVREVESLHEPKEHLHEYRARQIELGRHLLGQGRFHETWERLSALESEADHDRDFWILYAETLAMVNAPQAIAWMQKRNVEMPERYLLEFCIQSNPALAARALHEGKSKFPQDQRLQACRILELYETYHLTKKQADFQKAYQEWLNTPGNSEDAFLAGVYCLMADQPLPEYFHPFFEKLRNTREGRKPKPPAPSTTTENLLPASVGNFSSATSAPQEHGAEVKKEKFLAMIGYLPPLFFVPLMASPHSRFCRFHANQGLMVFLALAALQLAVPILFNVFSLLPFTSGILFSILSLLIKYAPLALIGIGIYHAYSDQCIRLPLIGDFDVIKSK